MKRRMSVALALCAMFLMAGSAGYAQVIHGCVGKFGGFLRVVSSPSQCTGLETPISWNVTGPAGPQGPAGITAGINAAVWGEYVFTPNAATPALSSCTVPFFRGADSVTCTPTGHDDEAILTFTLPSGQPQSWGTAYACWTSIVGGNATPSGTTCVSQGGMNAALQPSTIIQCLAPSGPVTSYFYVNFLCVN